MQVRPAAPIDIPTIVKMAEAFSAQTVYGELLAMKAERFAAVAQTFLDHPERTILLLVDEQGETRGMLAALVGRHPFSGEVIGGETAWWVEPAYRGHGIRLLRAAERWAKAHGACKMHMIAPTPDVERLYEARGYVPMERTYQRELG